MLRICLALGAAATLAACAQDFNRTEAESPTVSYTYTPDDDYEDVAEAAETYCDDNYDRGAVLLSRDVEGDRYQVTYSCE